MPSYNPYMYCISDYSTGCVDRRTRNPPFLSLRRFTASPSLLAAADDQEPARAKLIACRNCHDESRFAQTVLQAVKGECFASRASEILRHELRQNNPPGKSPKTCPAPLRKIFRLTLRANQFFNSARLIRMRGGSRSSRTRGGMRWTQWRA